MTLLLGGCQAGGSIWKETISLEPKDKTVSEETLDPETDIDRQVESEQVDGAELGVEMQGQDESGKLESEPGENDSNECSLLFAGDIYFSNHVLNAYDRVGGIGGVRGESLRETIAESDIFMANLEFPFSDRGTQAADKQFTFRVSPSRVSILQEIGPDIVTVANNHALDYGTDALLDTCDTLDSAGILHVGAGKNLEEAKQPQIIEKNGKKIGFLGASRVFPTGGWAAGSSHPGMFSAYDTASVVQEIQKVKKECDYLVVYVHWGIERNTQPEAYQREMGHQYIDAGADLVIGHHSHRMNPIEAYKGKYICYSLGNFSFAGNSRPDDMDTYIFQQRFRVYPDGTAENADMRIIPCSISSQENVNDFKPTPKDADGAAALLARLDKLNAQFEKAFAKTGVTAVSPYPTAWTYAY